jgi:hypothetical protein
MIKTNPKGLKDFQTCALLYELRHKEQTPETILGRDLMTEKFENTIKKVINYFLHKKQSGFTPSYSALLNRWQKEWFSEDTSIQDIITDKHETVYGNMSSLTSKAAASLLSFYEYFSDPEIIPIGISEQYFLPVNEVVVSGEFDLIFHKNKKINVIKWVFNYKTSHEHLYMFDFACMEYAYLKKKEGKPTPVTFGYYDILASSPEIKMIETSREDLEAVDYWTGELSSCNIFAPRRGLTYYCKKCPFDLPCSKWSKWNKEIEEK